MRVVLQRVHSASVSVVQQQDGRLITTTTTASEVARIGPGILALVGFHHDDTMADLSECCKQLVKAKLWDHPETLKPWKQSILQRPDYECLLVSQFTLYGTLHKKSKFTPDYKYSMKTEPAKALYEQFVTLVEQELPGRTKTGVFGAMMNVQLVNDGPVTLIVESSSCTAKKNNATNTSAIPSSVAVTVMTNNEDDGER